MSANASLISAKSKPFKINKTKGFLGYASPFVQKKFHKKKKRINRKLKKNQLKTKSPFLRHLFCRNFAAISTIH